MKRDRLALGIALCTSLLIANSALKSRYFDFGHSLHDFVSGPLLAIFFYQIGVEIRREIKDGELSQFRHASLPILGALGGMLLPALIFRAISPGDGGWAAAMPTDIALVLAALAFVRNAKLRIFLLSLAVADDLFSIIALAIFFPGQLSLSKALYSIGAVVLGLLIPAPRRIEERFLIPLTTYLIVPIYIFLYFGFTFTSDALLSRTSVAILVSRVIGKCLGISLFVYLALRLKISESSLSFREIVGGALLAGNGLTIALFLGELGGANLEHIRAGLFLAICLSSLLGLSVLLGGRSVPSREDNR